VRKPWIIALLSPSLLLGSASPAFAQQVPPVCTDGTRSCLLRTVSLYVDGLSRNDASAIPFAPRVRCTEQGNVEVTDEVTFRHEISALKVHLGVRNLRLLIDEKTGSVGAFYLLDIGSFEGKPPFTVRRGQRFKMVAGLITEVEVYNYFDRQNGKLAAPLWSDPAP
jgi:hypothetical protein